MTDSTEEDIQPADEHEESLRDVLEAAFTEAEEEPKEKPEVSEAPEVVSNELPEKENDSNESPAITEASTETIEAPLNWSARDRDEFTKIPSEHRGLILRRHKEMEADYTRKTQEIAEIRRNWEEVSREFEPFKNALALNGTNEVATIKRYVAIDKSLQQNPLETIKWLATQYNVNLSSSSSDETDSYVDPDILELRKQNQILQQEIGQFKGYIQQSNNVSVETQIKTFEEERDAHGNLKHPYFSDVVNDMAALLSVRKEKDLRKAYEDAVYANPVTRQKQLQAEKRNELLKQQEADRNKVAIAKRAASSITSGDNIGKQRAPANLTILEDLEAAYDSLVG
jgi:hypothetical protein